MRSYTCLVGQRRLGSRLYFWGCTLNGKMRVASVVRICSVVLSFVIFFLRRSLSFSSAQLAHIIVSTAGNIKKVLLTNFCCHHRLLGVTLVIFSSFQYVVFVIFCFFPRCFAFFHMW